MRVALLPGAGCEVVAQAADHLRGLTLVDAREDRDPGAYMLVEVGLWPAPDGVVEAVAAIPGDQDGHDPRAAEAVGDVLDRHAWERLEGREVVAGEPERVGEAQIPGEHDRPAPRHAAQLAQAAGAVLPVMV